MRTLTDAQLHGMTVDVLNSGLRCYRADLRYSRADAEHFRDTWNATRVSTRATIVTADTFPFVVIVED